MRNLSTKINDSAPASSGYLDAGEFNSTQEELENAVTSSPGGITLDNSLGPDSSSTMLAQSLTRHAAGGAIYCVATGDTTTHVISMADTNVTAPNTLFKGLTCRYDPPANNDGNPIAVNGFGLGAKPLVNHLSATPATGAIDGRVIDIYYDPAIGSGSWVLPAWSNALYVGQTPTSPPTVNSGEGWEVDGSNQGNLNFAGLTGDSTPESDDIFAFHDAVDLEHKAVTYAQLVALLGSGGGIAGMQFLSASGTYTKTPGVTKAIVIAVGGGGGGGGVSWGGLAPGGGGGGSVITFIDLSGIDTVEYTIGAGGTGGSGNGGGGAGGSTTFGTYATAGGGEGGAGHSTETRPGKGGISSVGLVQLDGGGGTPPTGQEGGAGGCSFLGGGGYSANYNYSRGSGGDGGRYGGGGGGADHSGRGGHGAQGCVIVMEFA